MSPQGMTVASRTGAKKGMMMASASVRGMAMGSGFTGSAVGYLLSRSSIVRRYFLFTSTPEKDLVHLLKELVAVRSGHVNPSEVALYCFFPKQYSLQLSS